MSELEAYVRKYIDWDWTPTEHDDLFGETPDDAHEWGVTDGEQTILHGICSMFSWRNDE